MINVVLMSLLASGPSLASRDACDRQAQPPSGPSVVRVGAAGVQAREVAAKVRLETSVFYKLYNIVLSTLTTVFRNMLLK